MSPKSPEGFDYDTHVNELSVDEKREMMSHVIESGKNDVIIYFNGRRILVQRSLLPEVNDEET